MSPAFENWFIVFVVVMTVSVVTQLGILISMFLSTRRVQQRVEKFLDNDVQPMIGETRALLAEGRKVIINLQVMSDEATVFARTQAGRIDELLSEAAGRARMQVVRVDDIVTDTLGRVERTTEQVHKTILAPLREIQAVLAGVRTAFEFLGGKRRPRGPVDRTTADEEMFI